MTQDLKRTPLHAMHEKLGARMVDFLGWHMPVQYTSLIEEHHAVRNRVGLFDVSHMGEIRVKGPQALDFLNFITVNDVSKLEDRQIQYSLMTYPEGTVVDDLLVYRLHPDEYLLVVNAGNTEKDWKWVQEHAVGFDVHVANESDDTAQLAVQGPLAQTLMTALTPVDLNRIAYYWFEMMDVAGVKALVSRTGYTGEDGFEIYTSFQDGEAVMKAILKAGESLGLALCGLGCRDTLRLEARMPLYGNDMDQTVSALEAGLGWAVKLKKDCDFIGKDALKAQKKNLQRKLVGFVMEDRAIARHGYPVLVDGAEVGHVTSGSHSPTLGKPIGLALLQTPHAKPGNHLDIVVRQKTHRAEIIKGPFYRREIT